MDIEDLEGNLQERESVKVEAVPEQKQNELRVLKDQICICTGFVALEELGRTTRQRTGDPSQSKLIASPSGHPADLLFDCLFVWSCARLLVCSLACLIVWSFTRFITCLVD